MNFFSASHPRASSPTGTAETSQADFQSPPRVVVSRSDLLASLSAFEALLSNAKTYRNSLLALSTASDGLAQSLEVCSRVKGADSSGSGLTSCAAFAHLSGNLYGVLADTLYRSVEIPLMEELDTYKRGVAERQAVNQAALKEKTKALRATEAANNKQARKGTRDLSSFRAALITLQAQVNDLDQLKTSHYSDLFLGESHNWSFILSKITLLLRCEVEIHDRLFSKATADAGLESLLGGHDQGDPWGAWGGEQDQAAGIYSILPPLGVGRSKSPSYVVSSASSVHASPSKDPEPAVEPPQDGPVTTNDDDYEATIEDESEQSHKSSPPSTSKLRKVLSVISESIHPSRTGHSRDSSNGEVRAGGNQETQGPASNGINSQNYSETAHTIHQLPTHVRRESQEADIDEQLQETTADDISREVVDEEILSGEDDSKYIRSEWAQESEPMNSPGQDGNRHSTGNPTIDDAAAVWTEN